MPVVLILILVIVYLVFQRNNQRIPFPIKYGVREHKINCIILLISGILVLPFPVFILLSELDIDINFNAVLGVIASLSVSSILLLVAAILKTIESFLYLKNLKKNGYIIPESRKDYGGSLTNLPRENGEIINMELKNYSREGRDRATLILVALSACMVIAFTLATVKYVATWYFVKGNSEFITGCMIFAMVCWTITTVVFFIQSSNEKYKDRVLLDDERKTRFTFAGGLSFIIIMGLITLGCFTVANQMTSFIFKSVRARDLSRLEDFRFAYQDAYDEYKMTEGVDIDKINERLNQGIDVMSLDEEDMLIEKTLEKIGHSDIKNYQNSIKLEGTSYTLVFDGEKIVGNYHNPH